MTATGRCFSDVPGKTASAAAAAFEAGSGPPIRVVLEVAKDGIAERFRACTGRFLGFGFIVVARGFHRSPESPMTTLVVAVTVGAAPPSDFFDPFPSVIARMMNPIASRTSAVTSLIGPGMPARRGGFEGFGSTGFGSAGFGLGRLRVGRVLLALHIGVDRSVGAHPSQRYRRAVRRRLS